MSSFIEVAVGYSTYPNAIINRPAIITVLRPRRSEIIPAAGSNISSVISVISRKIPV